MKTAKKTFVLTAVMVLMAVSAWAGPVQERLSFTKSTSLAVPDTYIFKFSLWTAATGGASVWSEQKTITMDTTMLTTTLGTVNPLIGTDFSRQYWVQVEEKKNPGDPFTVLGARTRLNVVPYAIYSIRGKDCDGGRFEDNGDGTVSDCRTGLVWLKNANCFGTMTWANAQAAVAGLASGSCGLNDGSAAGFWRMPNVQEWMAMAASGLRMGLTCPVITNAAGTGPWAPDDAFINVQTSVYWSSTTSATDSSKAWYMICGGAVYPTSKTGTAYVWPVRAAQ